MKPGPCFLFLATSARYSAGVKGEMTGVPVDLVAAEIDRDSATGVYFIKVNKGAESAKTRRTLLWIRYKRNGFCGELRWGRYGYQHRISYHAHSY